MYQRAEVPVRVRRVCSELRDLRDRSGLKAEDVSPSLGISMSKLSRMESGQRGLQVDDVCALLGLYRVPRSRRDQLLTMVRNGNDRNWWQVQDGQLPAMWNDVIRLADEATALRNYEAMFVPGPLQTGAYAAAVTQGTDPNLSTEDVESLVAARAGLQSVLCKRTPPAHEVLIEQAALQRPVGGPEVMSRQLRHLADVSQEQNTTVRVLPSSLGAHPGMEGPFVLLEFDGLPSLVYLEHRGNSAFLEEAQHVTATKQSLRWLRELALSAQGSIRLIEHLADEMT